MNYLCFAVILNIARSSFIDSLSDTSQICRHFLNRHSQLVTVFQIDARRAKFAEAQARKGIVGEAAEIAEIKYLNDLSLGITFQIVSFFIKNERSLEKFEPLFRRLVEGTGWPTDLVAEKFKEGIEELWNLREFIDRPIPNSMFEDSIIVKDMLVPLERLRLGTIYSEESDRDSSVSPKDWEEVAESLGASAM